jgi:hypothetical protein
MYYVVVTGDGSICYDGYNGVAARLLADTLSCSTEVALWSMDVGEYDATVSVQVEEWRAAQ